MSFVPMLARQYGTKSQTKLRTNKNSPACAEVSHFNQNIFEPTCQINSQTRKKQEQDFEWQYLYSNCHCLQLQ